MSWEDIAIERYTKPQKEQVQEMMGELIIAIPEGRKGLAGVIWDWLSGSRYASRQEAKSRIQILESALELVYKSVTEDGEPLPNLHHLSPATIHHLSALVAVALNKP